MSGLNKADSVLEQIAALPPLRAVIANHDLNARKSLGQNFLFDLNLTGKIARASGARSETSIIEVGPGPGGLTRAILLQGARNVTAIERDSRMVAALQPLVKVAQGRLRVIEADALTIDYQTIATAPRAIIANLPYNVATPLLIGWLRQAQMFDSMTLMFQKEVAQRIVASPNSSAYGRLSVMAQWVCDATLMFDVPASAFVPPPKITSSIVCLRPRILPPEQPDFAIVEAVTAAAFGQRRKMLRQSLKTLTPDAASLLESVGITETKRAEDLSVDDFIRLAQAWQTQKSLL